MRGLANQVADVPAKVVAAVEGNMLDATRKMLFDQGACRCVGRWGGHAGAWLWECMRWCVIGDQSSIREHADALM